MADSHSHIIKRQILELHGLRQEDAHDMQERMRRLYYSHLLPIIDRHLSRLSPNGQTFRIEKLELDLGAIDALDFDSELLRELERQLQAQLGRLTPPEEAPAAAPRPPEAPGARHRELFQYFVETGSLPWWANPQSDNPVVESLDYLLEQEPHLLVGDMRRWLPREFYLRRLVRQLPPDRILRLAGLQARLPAGNFEQMAAAFFQLLGPLSAALDIRHSRLLEEARLKLLQAAFFRPAPVTEATAFWQEWLLQLAVVFRIKYARWLEALQANLSEPTAADLPPKAGATAIIRQLAEEHQGAKKPTPSPPVATTPFQELFESLAEALRKMDPEASVTLKKGKPLEAIIQWLTEEIRKEGAPPSTGAKTADSLLALLRQLAEELQKEGQPASAASNTEYLLRAVSQKLKEEQALSDEGQAVLAQTFRHWLTRPTPSGLKALSGLLETILSKNEKLRPALAKQWASHLEAVLREPGLPARLRKELPPLIQKLRAGSLGRPEIDSMLQLLAEARPQTAGQERPAQPTIAKENAVAAEKLRSDSFSKTGEIFINNTGLVILWPYLPRFFQSLGLVEDKQFVDAAAMHRAAGLLQFLADGLPETPEYLLAFNKVLCGLPWDEVLEFGEPVTEAEAEECDVFLQAVIANAPVLKNMSVDGFRGTFLLRKGMLRPLADMWELHVEKETYDVVLNQFPWSWKLVKLPWLEKVVVVEW